LCLGGGGARGIAHIGFLSILQNEKISFQSICATSFGGFVGAALAVGITPQELETEALRISQTREFIKLLDPNPLRRGLLEGNRVKSYIENLLGGDFELENLRFPLKLVTVDLVTGNEIVLDKGDLLQAIYATIAIPGIFKPIEIGKRILVDGGVLNNLPVDYARNMGAKIVIAVNVSQVVGERNPWEFPQTPYRLIPNAITSMYRAEAIQANQLTQTKLFNSPPDLLIQPDIPDQIDPLFGFRFASAILEAGKQAAIKSLDQIHSLLWD
jgi:NTE family protein